MDIELYHYHETTKEYTGTTKARLSPLDLKQGRVYYLKPPCTTEITPPFDAKPPGNWVVMWYDTDQNVWKYRNTSQAKQQAQKQDIVKKMVNEQNFLLVETKKDSENQGLWYILYWNGQPEYYSLIHENDQKQDTEKFESYQEVKFEIEVIEGRAKDTDLDSPITEEETKNSQERWQYYENQNRAEIVAGIEQQEIDFQAQLQSELEKEQINAQAYLDQMTSLVDKDQQEMQTILEQKAAVKLAILRGEVNQLLAGFVANRKG